jgi:mono/diheme cytochrome c family protein
MKKSSIVILLVVFTACSVKLIPPAQSDVDRVSNQYPGYTLADLNQGKALFETTCNRCHGLKNPTSRGEDKWKEIVPEMVRKLNKKKGTVVVDEQQQELIVRYLVTMSRK